MESGWQVNANRPAGCYSRVINERPLEMQQLIIDLVFAVAVAFIMYLISLDSCLSYDFMICCPAVWSIKSRAESRFLKDKKTTDSPRANNELDQR